MCLMALKRSYGVFIVFFKLGLYAFGGPLAHIAYFRTQFVERLRWLSDQQLSQIIAICQLLPGPSSSQVGFTIGLIRAGGLGALAAFIGFTLPSVIFVLLFAKGVGYLPENMRISCIDGLKIMACIVMTQAVISMFIKLCDQTFSKLIAALCGILVVCFNTQNLPYACMACGAVFGYYCLKTSPQKQLEIHFQIPYGKRLGLLYIGLFTGLFAVLLIPQNQSIALAELFYRAGALVFGGGHVVLPLLQTSLVDSGLISQTSFLSGYGIAQALPGPLFSVSAYYGYQVGIGEGCALSMAAIALSAFFCLDFCSWLEFYHFGRSYIDSPKRML